MTDSPDIRLSVIIPAYNEELRLSGTLQDVLQYLHRQSYRSEVIVVDDGSSDNTAGVACSFDGEPTRVRLHAHPGGANRGKGASVKLGMAHARGRYRLFMDADNSTALDQIDGFWPEFESNFDVVIGSRKAPGASVLIHQAWYKELAGRCGNLLIRSLAVPGIYDTQAGFKMFTERCAEMVFPRLTVNRWGFDVEALAIARSLGFRIREVPIVWINSPASKVGALSYFKVVAEVLRVRRNLKAGLYK